MVHLKGPGEHWIFFLGRVDTEVTSDGIKEPIRDIFSIEVIYVKQLVIRSNEFNAFKITVNAGD